MSLIDRLKDALSESHLWGHGFDPDVCRGTHPDVDGVCPNLQEGNLDTCGCCGCPIFNLDKANAPPESCPQSRLDAHESR
ncbi:MAG: hypothetical protein ACOCTH_02810 [Halodesulfurarchaeum sp.]